MKSIVEISQFCKDLGDFKLGPIHFSMNPGTITALVGNNGSGKSTLIKSMMGLVKSNQGTIKMFDQFVHEQDESWKKEVAYQPQTTIGADAFTGRTLRDLISYFYPNWDDELFTKVVGLLDINVDKRYGKLSQGSQQKLTFALTIARNARLLILDEPTAHIDILSKKIMIDVLVDWMDEDENRSIVISSHQIEDIRKLSDYIYVLNNGQPVGHFEKESLTESYRRYFFNDPLPELAFPGEVARESHSLISNQPEEIERFLDKNSMEWSNRSAIELEEVLEILLRIGTPLTKETG